MSRGRLSSEFVCEKRSLGGGSPKLSGTGRSLVCCSWDTAGLEIETGIGTLVRREFYTLTEAARVLEIPQRRLLRMLETGEIEGEQDPHSSRWKIPKHAVDELASSELSPESPAEKLPEQSTEMVQELVDELGNLQREVGRLRHRLDLARRAEKEERELLLAELEQEQESHRQERDRLLEDQRRDRERANQLQEEVNRLREELESERNKTSWRKLFGG
jgi:excisionase family DNA binding protein